MFLDIKRFFSSCQELDRSRKMVDIALQNQEQQVKNLKRLLEGWRMALLPLKSVILWEEQWHPGAIVGTVSFFYFLIWLMDLNLLTTFAVVGLLLNFVDFIVPIICNSIYGPSAWTGQKEEMYEDICRSIVANYNKANNQLRNFCSMRETSPCMYYVISSSVLLNLALISSTLNNTLLLYVLSILTLLWPGIHHRGMFNKAPKQLKSE